MEPPLAHIFWLRYCLNYAQTNWEHLIMLFRFSYYIISVCVFLFVGSGVSWFVSWVCVRFCSMHWFRCGAKNESYDGIFDDIFVIVSISISVTPIFRRYDALVQNTTTKFFMLCKNMMQIIFHSVYLINIMKISQKQIFCFFFFLEMRKTTIRIALTATFISWKLFRNV